ncbi:unnamed protein product, partial [Effrenium voratum]
MSWMQAQKSDRYCGELPLSCRVCPSAKGPDEGDVLGFGVNADVLDLGEVY